MTGFYLLYRIRTDRTVEEAVGKPSLAASGEPKLVNTMRVDNQLLTVQLLHVADGLGALLI